MNGHGLPEHACVRVGPLSGGTLTAGWPQDCAGAGGQCRGGSVVTGMLLVADDNASSRLLEAADVIIAAGEEGSTSPGEWLSRYPGCAVVAAQVQRGECSVATRHGVIAHVAISGQDAAGAFACGVFVHGWLAAQWPVRLLQPPRLEVGYHATIAEPEPDRPLFFRFSYR